MTEKKQQPILDEYKKLVDGSTSMIVARYETLPADDCWGLRKSLMDAGSQLEVVRKLVFFQAVKEYFPEIGDMKGNLCVVFVNQTGKNPMDSAKILYKYADTHLKGKTKTLEVLAGRIEGEIIKGAELKELASLPPLQDMRQIFVSLLASPMKSLLYVMNEHAAQASPSSTEPQS